MGYVCHSSKLLTFCFFLFSISIHAQTDTLLNPNKEGGFELGNGSFTANGWSVANNPAQTNQWTSNRGAVSGFKGQYCAYITNDPTGNPPRHQATKNDYTIASFYRDVSFPAGKTAMKLSFLSIAPSMQVSLVRQNASLTSGIVLTTLNTTQYDYQTITLDPSLIGNCQKDTTWRLVFTWQQTYGYTGVAPVIDAIELTVSPVPTPFNVTNAVFTIDNTRPTNGNNFRNFTDAINALNTNTLANCQPIGAITFNVQSGQVFEEYLPKITATGRATLPIVFQKDGSGANPVIKPKPTNRQKKIGIYILGGDYFTFDGIDIDGRAQNISSLVVEVGYKLENASDTNGAQYNTIKNCKIILDNRVKATSIGMYQYSNPDHIPANDAGTNSNNRYLNLNIKNCYYGVLVHGNISYHQDTNIEIGSTDAAHSTELGEAQGLDMATGIDCSLVSDLKIHHINSSAPFKIGYCRENIQINNNKIITLRGNYALNLYCEVGLNAILDTVAIFNNFFSVLPFPNKYYDYQAYRGAVTVALDDILTELKFYNNTVYINEPASIDNTKTGSCFYLRYGKAFLLNNIFFNASSTTSQNDKYTCLLREDGTTLRSDNNAFWRTSASTNIGILRNQWVANTLTEWQNRSGMANDSHSIEADPLFFNPLDLHIHSTVLDGKGATPPYNLATDIDNEACATPYDIGADQFTRQPIDIAITDLLEPNDSTAILCENTLRTLKVSVTNVGASALNFAQHPTTVRVIISKPNSNDTLWTTISSGILAVDSSRIIDVTAFTPLMEGKYTFHLTVSTIGDDYKLNDTAIFVRTLLPAQGLPLVEVFNDYNYVYTWRVSAGVGLFDDVHQVLNHVLAAQINSNNQNQTFLLPKISKITDTSTIISFDYRIVTSSDTILTAVRNASNWGQILVLASTDCGEHFTKIKTLDPSNHQESTNFRTVQIPLSMFQGNVLMIKFVVEGHVFQETRCDFDNIIIGKSCRRLSGMDSVELLTPPPVCIDKLVSLKVQSSSADVFGINYLWQYSTDSLQTWRNAANQNYINKTYDALVKGLPLYYRLKTTCVTDSSNRFSKPMLIQATNTPIVAKIPFKESFESWQTGICTEPPYTNDIPSQSWVNQTYYESNSWRRNDEGNTAGLSCPTCSDFSPAATTDNYSAHCYSRRLGINNSTGYLDLYVDLSGSFDKALSFDYIHPDGDEVLNVSLSMDNGFSFVPIDTPLSITANWRGVNYILPANGSPKSILRFQASIDPNKIYTQNIFDIGLDNLTINNSVENPSCTQLSLPQDRLSQAQDDELLTWLAADHATGYRLKIGTTANGADVLNWTDLGQTRQYRYPNFFDYQKTYFVTLEPYNTIGATQGCPSVSFTTVKNPNFGGGNDGIDVLHPLSGGYYFANSTASASSSPFGKANYSWINTTNHTEIRGFDYNGGNGSNDDGVFTLLGLDFKFPFYNSAVFGSPTINFGTDGIIAIHSGLPAYSPTKTIPSANNPVHFLAPCYANLFKDTDSHFYIKSDSNQFVATWWHFYSYNNNVVDTAEYITFQVILTPDGHIKYQYNAEESSVGRLINSRILETALVGIEGIVTDFQNPRGIQYRNKGQGARLFDAQNKSVALSFQTYTLPNCVNWLYPTDMTTGIPIDATLRWKKSAGAKGYKIKIGTSANGSEFLALTDVGVDTLYKPLSKLGFLTRYYVTVMPYDSLGYANSACEVLTFTTSVNPNFGGGLTGNDPRYPYSGGYYFANSTFAASAALPSQPTYNWVDPLSNHHTSITNWHHGNTDNGYFLLPDIGFNFSFYDTTYRNNIYVNSNGSIHFLLPDESTGGGDSIPNFNIPRNFIAACRMDLAAGTDGKIYYGNLPNGNYVITWWHYHDVNPNGSVDTAEYITFQVILNPNGTIKIQYNNIESSADDGVYFDILNDALIGIESLYGNLGIQYRNNGGPAPMFSSPLAIAFALNNKLLSVQNPANTEGVSVGNAFPNPSSNQFVFDFYTPQKMVLTLQLSNSLGQVVWTDKSKSQLGWQQKTVDWNELPAGIYWLAVATEQGQRFVQRVIRN